MNMDMSKIAEFWNVFSSGNDLEGHVSSFAKLSGEDIDLHITGNVTLIKSWKDLSVHFSSLEFESVQSWVKYFLSKTINETLLSHALNDSRITLPSITGCGYARSDFGVAVGLNNFIRFVDDGFTFFVCQRLKSFNGIYFPSKNIFYAVDCPVTEIFLLNREIVRLLSSLECKNELAPPIKKENICGILIDFERPYHYFYDLLPFFDDVVYNCADRRNICAIYFDYCYLDLSIFYGFEHSMVKTTRENLNDYMFRTRTACLCPGYPTQGRNRNEPAQLYDLDRRVVDFSVQNNKEKIELTDSFDFVLWLGFSNEKRQWLEQLDCTEKLVNYLLSLYSSVLVVVDGLTASNDGVTDSLIKRSKNELSNIRYLTDKFEGRPVAFKSLIGATSVEKIAFSSKIDFFICDFLTDSMWPARFGLKPGIGFGALEAKKILDVRKDHVHTQTYFLADEIVKDVRKQTTSNWARFDISILPDEFMSAFVEIHNNIFPDSKR